MTFPQYQIKNILEPIYFESKTTQVPSLNNPFKIKKQHPY